jgi:hypothetical protein
MDTILVIIDIDPVWSDHVVNVVEIPGEYTYNLAVSDGYAYVPNSTSISTPPYSIETLYVIDVDPVDSAHIVSSLDFEGAPRDIAVYNGYAYIAACDVGLKIIKLW